jgi:hypothetical protein
MPDKVILDNKKSYLVYFDNFHFHFFTYGQTLDPKKINLGLDSEFNSIHFCIEINKSLKFLRPEKLLGPKVCDKFETS